MNKKYLNLLLILAICLAIFLTLPKIVKAADGALCAAAGGDCCTGHTSTGAGAACVQFQDITGADNDCLPGKNCCTASYCQCETTLCCSTSLGCDTSGIDKTGHCEESANTCCKHGCATPQPCKDKYANGDCCPATLGCFGDVATDATCTGSFICCKRGCAAGAPPPGGNCTDSAGQCCLKT